MNTQEPTEETTTAAPGPEATVEAKLAWIERTTTALDERGAAVLGEVFSPIVDAHSRRVWRRILTWGIAPEEAEDVMQDVFLELFNHIRHQGAQPGLRRILDRITKGHLLHHARDRRSEPESVALPSSGSALPESEPDVDRAVYHRALARRLLPELSEIHRAVIELCILGDKTDPEAAAILRIPEGTLKSLLAAAKRELRKLAMRWVPPSQQEVA